VTVTLRLGHLYSEAMNVYGDRGNVIALQRRSEARGIPLEVHRVGVEEELDLSGLDILLVGGGQDGEQMRVAADLASKGEQVRLAVDAGMPMLAVCGGFQLFGTKYVDEGGAELTGIGVFDMVTRHPGGRTNRCVGNVVLDTPFGEVVGFENHGGRTFLGPGQQPFGTVQHGSGNNTKDHTEGARRLNAIGTYLHGSLLPKNPKVTDFLLNQALQRKTGEQVELERLDDSVELAAHRRAVEVAKRRR